MGAKLFYPKSTTKLAAAALVSIGLAAVTFLVATAWGADPTPLRKISDPNPNFSGITVDTTNNEIIVSDDNGHSVIVYARTASGPAIPLRRIQGNSTQIDFPASAVVDVANNEVWSAMNDTSERAVVHTRTANGNAIPLRVIDFKLAFPTASNRSYGWSVDTVNGEVAGTFQRRLSVAFFDRATGDLLREIIGANTNLNDPHGNFVDNVNNEVFVTNEGHILDAPPALPSITVYNRADVGNVAPKRTVQGPLTGLNVPKLIHVDLTNNEMAVANGGNNSITIYNRLDNGNVAPLRTIAGALTGLSNPTGVFIDAVNNEILVTNWGNHTITVYNRLANGNVAPLRTITTAPGGAQVGIGNPGALALDLVNNEIGATNCVSHPRVAIWNRLDNGQVAPKRVLSGANSRISRSTHGIWIDTVNNEIVVPSGSENSILVFNRLDSGDVAPKRVIQGSLTTITSASKGVMVDNVNNEIVMPKGTDGTGLHSVGVWDRLANGNVAPKRSFSCECFSSASPVGVWVDATNNEIYVVEGGSTPGVHVFDRLATGTVTPIRSITGAATMLDKPRQMALDLVNNEITVANNGERAVDPPIIGSITVYNRLDNGNVAPKRFIQGPNSGLFAPRAVYVDNVNNEIGEGDSKLNDIRIFPRLF